MVMVFKDRIDCKQLDSSAFTVRHGLEEHPSLQLEALAQMHFLKLTPVSRYERRDRTKANFWKVINKTRNLQRKSL